MTEEIGFDKGVTAVVAVAPGVCGAIAGALGANKGEGAIRVELASTGCCDATLGLRLDRVGESDLVEEVEGLTFVMSRKTYELAGRVTISCRGNGEFVLNPEKPVSEWDGFGSCPLRK